MAHEELNEENLTGTRRTQQARVLDVLEKAKEFHTRLARFYEQRGSEVNDEKTRLALEYLSSHEQCLVETIDAYERDAPDAVVEVWVKYTPELPVDELLEKATIPPDATADDVAEFVFKMNEKLLHVYREMAEQAPSESTREALDDLLALEKREEIRAMRGTEME